MVRTQIKPRHDSVNSIISNVSNSASKSSQSLSRLSSLSAANNHQDTDPDIMPKLIIAPIIDKKQKRKQKPSAIEMSEDRVRKLSGQIDEHQLKQLIDQYDNDNHQKITIEHTEEDDDGLISPSDDIDDNDV